MAGETLITVIGNLTADPEMRFTTNGAAVASFTIASTPKTFDRQTNEFKDGDPLFLRSSVWREQAENVAETLTKGMRVIAQGYLKQRSYEDKKTQEKRTVYELEVQEIGPALRFASAKVTRTNRSGGNGGGGTQSQPPQQNQQSSAGGFQGQGSGGWNAPSNDPWATNQPAGNGGGWGNPQPGNDEPPF